MSVRSSVDAKTGRQVAPPARQDRAIGGQSCFTVSKSVTNQSPGRQSMVRFLRTVA